VVDVAEEIAVPGERATVDSEDNLETSLLGTLEEISCLVVSHTGNVTDTLTNIARLIQQRFHSDVCSVYLLAADHLHLILSATVGLDASSVGHVRMRLNQGLVGLVGERRQPQVFADATAHPRFKYFPESGEERYQSFLGVPIIERGSLLGVMVVQTIEPRQFSRDDVRAVANAASQLSPIVNDARFMHESQLQAERLRVVQVTMRTVQDIVNNCLNQLQLLRLAAESLVPDESLILFDEAIRNASEKLRALGNMEVFAEKLMAAGTGLDVEGSKALDPLTDLHDGRYVQERLAAEIARAQRHQSSLTVLTLDLNDFKRINNRYGYPAGNLALQRFAKRLSSAIRASDLAVRMSGDEFVVLLPECKLGQIQAVLNRLSPLEIEVEGSKVSFALWAGWAEYRVGETPEQLLQRADHSLCVDKQNRKREPQPVA
jgi:diguanylate cyclase (GGDEF)-like protein